MKKIKTKKSKRLSKHKNAKRAKVSIKNEKGNAWLQFLKPFEKEEAFHFTQKNHYHQMNPMSVKTIEQVELDVRRCSMLTKRN